MSSSGHNNEDCPGPAASLLPWPEQKRSKSAALPTDWERFAYPKELQYLPDSEQTPYELRQIIKRSLYRHEVRPSSSREARVEVPDSSAAAPVAPKALPGVSETQTCESGGSAQSWQTCGGGDEPPSTAAGDAASLVPKPVTVVSTSGELKPKSSFLPFRIGRLGAKIERLELVSSRRSSRNVEQPKVVPMV